MKSSQATIALWCALALAMCVAGPRSASAQSGVIRNDVTPPGMTNVQPVLPPDSSVAPGVPANPTLEIAPHVMAAPSPVATAVPPASNDDDDKSDAGGTLDDALHRQAAPKQPDQPNETLTGLKRPYIGLAAQYIETHDPPWHTVQGLEVVSVDQGSPAARAGLKGRGAMTSVGETGATASTMMAPLDLIVMPLLKKTGSLGASGDLIVAIDDQRIDNADALKNALDQTKPGDILYLTIVRTVDGKKATIKVPVKLDDAKQAVANSASDGAAKAGGGN
jgi:hypothetical protein